MSEGLEDLRGRTVLFGVTGGIAAYKAVDVVSRLRERGADVHVIMTEAATQLVRSLTFRTLSANPVYTDMFDEPRVWNVQHIALAERGDILAVIPATANIMAKAAAGIADDFLSTLLVAFDGPRLMAPAMNPGMWNNPATQRNRRQLEDLGFTVVEPDCGRLASGASGRGRLPPGEVLEEEISSLLHADDALAGRRVLVTAGPTREYFDPVRFLTSPSSGKMGYALARAARERGARVDLVSGPVNLASPRGVRCHQVVSASDMLSTCLTLWPEMDILLMAAAVSEYRPAEYRSDKISKTSGDDLGPMTSTPDIISTLSQYKEGRFVLGFAAETGDEELALGRAEAKLVRKGMDTIVLNIVGGERGGFASDLNRAVLIDSGGREELPMMHKRSLARLIVDRVVLRIGEGSR
ncbi:MAG: bifunctional phosphopantothenoylcysteine decarboxylase/phosphopantothenate--cysteine ligase CoaBC [Bacillota bacterium]